ncbi:MAG: alpha/beta fold hydrolase, partial [Comamonadaceae bacterium]
VRSRVRPPDDGPVLGDQLLRAGPHHEIQVGAHLPRVRCPTLVMCGDSDQLTPPECSAEIAQLVPGAELRMVARTGHMLTMEQPAEVSALLRAWLERLAARPAG